MRFPLPLSDDSAADFLLLPRFHLSGCRRGPTQRLPLPGGVGSWIGAGSWSHRFTVAAAPPIYLRHSFPVDRTFLHGSDDLEGLRRALRAWTRAELYP